jgi:hypothetical protein
MCNQQLVTHLNCGLEVVLAAQATFVRLHARHKLLLLLLHQGCRRRRRHQVRAGATGEAGWE